MMQKLPTEPHHSDSTKLASDMFLELIITSYDSIRTAVGSENANKVLHPHFENCGKAGYYNVGAGLDLPEAEKLMKFWLWSNHAVTKSCVKGSYTESSVMLEDKNCPFEGKVPELCHGYCQTAAEASIREIWPECNFSQIPGDDSNEHTCRWMAFIVRDNHMPSKTPNEKEAKSILEDLSADYFDWLAHAIPGELLVIATRAMIEIMDQDKTSLITLPRFNRCGMDFATRYLQHFGLGKGDAESMSKIIETICSAQNQKNRFLRIEKECAVGEIRECPYSDSPDLLCRQFEAFLNGVCSRFNPDFVFKYEQMMTHGDQYCTWKIVRKDIAQSQKSDRPITKENDEHPQMILMRRLARGEISIKEYEELKAFIASEMMKPSK